MSSDLRTAVEDLRAALVDEDAGNGHVRDCAFEVVATWDADAERTAYPGDRAPAHPAAVGTGREHGAHLQPHQRAARRRSWGGARSSSLLELASQVQRFVNPTVAEYRRRLHADETHLQDYGKPDGNGAVRRRRGGDRGVTTRSNGAASRAPSA